MAQSGEDSSLPQTILLVEDNPGDARLVKEMCSDMGLSDLFHTVSTGSDALDFVNQRGEHADVPRTDLVVLDWHLSRMKGREVLEELNSNPVSNHIPVIVITGSLSESEVHEVYEKNANACITKPAGPDELKEIIQAFEAFWLSIARLPSSDDGQQ